MSPAMTELAGGSYSSASLALVASQASVVAMTEYTSGARLYAVSLMAISIVSQSLQGWVTERGADVAKRLGQALLVQTSLGILGLLAFVALGPLTTRILFGERLAASFGVMSGFGVAFLAVALNTAMGRHILIVAGFTRSVMSSTLLGAAIGVPLILLLAQRHGAAGGAWALAISEISVCVWQLAPCRRALRILRRA